MLNSTLDIVLPATGQHSWHISEGWVESARRIGVLGRVFRPEASWTADAPENDDGLLAALNSGNTSEIVLVLGMDWHSQPLTRLPNWIKAWKESPSHILALIWEDYTSEFVQGQPDFLANMISAGRRMCECADWVYTLHEDNVEFFKSTYSYSSVTFQPFSVDEHFLQASTPFREKRNDVFFKGKIDKFGYEHGPYKRRSEIANALQIITNALQINCR